MSLVSSLITVPLSLYVRVEQVRGGGQVMSAPGSGLDQRREQSFYLSERTWVECPGPAISPSLPRFVVCFVENISN